MNQDFRVKENIVHISLIAGTLLQQDAIETDSQELTNTIIELADQFEKEMVPTLEEDTYLEAIELFAYKELLKAFSIVDFLPIGGMNHVDRHESTFYFYVNEELVDIEAKDGEIKHVTRLGDMFVLKVMDYLEQQNCRRFEETKTYEDSVLTVVSRKLNFPFQYELGQQVKAHWVTGEMADEEFLITHREEEDGHHYYEVEGVRTKHSYDALPPAKKGDPFLLVTYEVVS